MSDKIGIGLRIEPDTANPERQVGLVIDESRLGDVPTVHIMAHNWEESEDGARAIVAFLKDVAEGIERQLDKRPIELGTHPSTEEHKPKHPRFNPKPRGV